MEFLLKLVGFIVFLTGLLYLTEAYLTMNYFRACVALSDFMIAALLIFQPKLLKV